MDADAQWRSARPGPPPFKPEGNVFEGVPGLNKPWYIKPDLVHTFHIGFGADFCASTIVWLAKLGKFGHARKLDERLRNAYSAFRHYCHTTNRFTACDEWSTKKFGMTTILGFAWHKILPVSPANFLWFDQRNSNWPCLLHFLRTADWPTSLAGKGHDTGVVCRWLGFAFAQFDARPNLLRLEV